MRITPGLAAGRLRTVDGWDRTPNLRRAVRLAEHMGHSADIAVGEALDLLHPGGSPEAKSETLRRVVEDVRSAVADVTLVVEVTEQPGGVRRLFFSAERVTESSAHLAELGTVGDEFIGRQAATVQLDGKPLVRIFLSYSAKDRSCAEELWNRLRAFTDIDRTYRFELWDFKKSLQPGEDWHPRTLEAIARGDLGIFAVSPHFLGSDYIHRYELPEFLARNAALPILLTSMNLRAVDPKSLEGRQIFRYRDRAYDDSDDERQRNAWVEALRDAIHKMLERRVATNAAHREKRSARAKLDDLDDLDYRAPLFVHPGRLPGDPEQAVAHSGSQVDAVEYLVEWAGARRSPLAAVLGEYGMGKTITCQAVVREIHRRREAGNDHLPEPLYFDLRNVSGLRQRERVPTLTEILQECVDRGWTAGDSGRPRAEELLARAADSPTLFIVDGLDEALVHLNTSDGAILTRELLGLRPPRDGRDPVAGLHTKVLLSCRTHYFRSVAEQYGHFTGQHRDVTHRDDFEALLLLPLTDDQVRRYLDTAVPGRDAGQVFDMLAELHDLSDLTSRPVTLKLVAQQIAFIENRRARELPIQPADIYQRIAEDWLERDKGKEQLRAADKLTLTGRLAAWMWLRNSRVADLDQIENWLHEQIDTEPALRRRYGRIDPVLLEEDLRTATFLVRQDTADGSSTQGFRFAHTSFQEFFLARYLLDAVDDDQPGNWCIEPSDETLDLLGQLLHSHRDHERLISTLSQWRHRYRKQASELMLRYTLQAADRGHPCPELSGMDLSGANLSGWTIGRSHERSFSLSGAQLVGADLRNSQWDFVDLSGADMTAAQLDNAVLHRCRLDHALLYRTDLTGALFHFCGLDGAQLSDAKLDGMAHVGATSEFPDPEAPAYTLLTPLGGHTDWVLAVTWSPNGTRLLTGSNDSTARLWDAHTGQPLHILAGHIGPVEAVAWSPDGNRLLTGSTDKTARVWNAHTGQPLHILTGHSGPVSAVAWSPDGTRLLTGSHDDTARLWDARTGQPIHTLTGHTRRVNAVAWSPDSTRLLTGSHDDTARLWDARTGQPIHTLTGHTRRVNAVAWSPDSTRLLTGSHDDTARLWDARTGQPLRTLTGHTRPVNAVAWSPDGTRLLTGSDDQTARLWGVSTGQPLDVLVGHARPVEAVAWSPDGARLLTGSADRTARLWDAHDGRPQHVLIGHIKPLEAAVWSPDGTRLLTGDHGHAARLWDSMTGQPLETLTGQTHSPQAVAWSPDGTRLLTGSSRDDTAHVWDAQSGKPLNALTGHTHSVRAVAWSPDGTRLSTASHHTIRLWDTRSGQLLRTLTGHTRWVMAMTWSPDGTRLLTGSNDHTARLWDAHTGQPIHTLTEHTNSVRSVSWSPNGTHLLTGSSDHTARLWDARTGRPLRVLAEHAGPVNTVAWSPDGTRLLTGSHDHTARLWDAHTGRLLHALTEHTGPVNTVAWSPDGTRALTGSSDGTLRVWDSAGDQVLQVIMLDDNQSAAWSPKENLLLSATPDAWRYLRAAYFDEDGRILGLQPYERRYIPTSPSN
ncbi:eIF2A-related protein [Nocardia takedensis]|uniref:WD40 domain-containing protein n=1 Tax=Nocardia takedensis TaxID=259390 RepID=UPI003F771F5E